MTEITQLGRYQVLGKLAVGGMAEVFLARQDGPAGFTKTAVIKQILPSLAEDRKLVGMFLNEARLAALITHPNVAQIFELGGVEEGETPWLAMEWVDGKSLARVLKAAHDRGQALTVEVAASIVAEACAGLEAAHSLRDASGKHLGLVHRDVSPENILVSFQGHVKLVDFGVAKAMAADSTRTATLRGKFAYLSPEQVLGEEIDCRSDIFSIGVVLYRSLSGWLPFRGKTEFEVMKKIVADLPAPLGHHVPFALAKIVDRCLVKSREARYATAREVQVDLQAFLAQHGGGGSLEIGDFLQQLHPPESDPDRIRVQRILAGEALADPAGAVAKVPVDSPSGTFALQEMQESPSEQPPPLPTAFDPAFVSAPIRRAEGPAQGVFVEEQQEVMVVTTGEVLAITAPIGTRPGAAPAADPVAAVLAGFAPMPGMPEEPVAPVARPATGSRKAVEPRPASGQREAVAPRPPTGSRAAAQQPAEPRPPSGSRQAVAPRPPSGSQQAVAPRPPSGSQQAVAPRPPSGSQQAVPRQPTGRTALQGPPQSSPFSPDPLDNLDVAPARDVGAAEADPELPLPPLPPEPRSSRAWIWGVAGVVVLGLAFLGLRGPLGLTHHVGPPIPEGAATGHLHIEVTAGARVRIDGVDIGLAPVDPVEVAEGMHDVVIVHPQSQNEKSFSVNVPAGVEKTFKVKLDP